MEWNKNKFTVVRMRNSVYYLLFINYCIIFHMNNCKPTFASPWKCDLCNLFYLLNNNYCIIFLVCISVWFIFNVTQYSIEWLFHKLATPCLVDKEAVSIFLQLRTMLLRTFSYVSSCRYLSFSKYTSRSEIAMLWVAYKMSINH